MAQQNAHSTPNPKPDINLNVLVHQIARHADAGTKRALALVDGAMNERMRLVHGIKDEADRYQRLRAKVAEALQQAVAFEGEYHWERQAPVFKFPSTGAARVQLVVRFDQAEHTATLHDVLWFDRGRQLSVRTSTPSAFNVHQAATAYFIIQQARRHLINKVHTVRYSVDGKLANTLVHNDVRAVDAEQLLERLRAWISWTDALQLGLPADVQALIVPRSPSKSPARSKSSQLAAVDSQGLGILTAYDAGPDAQARRALYERKQGMHGVLGHAEAKRVYLQPQPQPQPRPQSQSQSKNPGKPAAKHRHAQRRLGHGQRGQKRSTGQLRRTQRKVTLSNGKLRTVYVGARGGEYIKLDGQVVSLRKLTVTVQLQ